MLRVMCIANSYSIGLTLILVAYSWMSCYTSAVEYGPSLASLTGVYLSWKPDIWSLEYGRRVKLSQYPGYSTVIPLITAGPEATSEQIFQERGVSTIGEFTVEAPPSYGVIAVIQELKLRKSSIVRERTYNTSCLDYVQFGDPKSGPGSVSGKICGIVRRDDMTVKPAGLIGPRTFMSTGGKIRMSFNHAYVAELVDALLQGGNPRRKAILRVEVAFTAFKTNCSDEWINSTTEDTAELETFEACSDYSKLINQTCISSRLLCDDVYNCGGDGDSLGSDDQQTLCPDKPMRTTEKEPDESETEQTERPSVFNAILNLAPPFEQRRFTPYVSPSDNTPTPTKTPSYSYRKPNSSSLTSTSANNGIANSKTSAMQTHVENRVLVQEPVASDNVVRPIGSYSISKSPTGDISENHPKRVDIDDPAYGRRELADAINSVIYGVALFIVFTIFITLFVIYIGRRIQMNLSQRNSRGSIAPVVAATAVATPTIRPSTTTAVITRDNASCNNTQTRELAFSSSNTTVVLVTLPQHSQNGDGTYDLPPSYDTLFPTPNPNIVRS